MQSSLIIVQVVVALLLILVILLQNRGTGAGMAFGSDFGSYYAKRGFEKVLFYASVVLGCAFVVLAGVNTLLFR
jgi:protein translocase SecG subunit